MKRFFDRRNRRNINRLMLVSGLCLILAGQARASSGILYSRIGYNLADPKQIMIRSEEFSPDLDQQPFFILNQEKTDTVFSGAVRYWGELWKSHWWVLDFSSFGQEGTFTCVVNEISGLKTEPFRIGQNLLWDKTWKTVSLEQLEGRIDLRNKNIERLGPEYAEGGGWQDCGSYLRELNSHATMIVGLLDLLEYANDRIPMAEIRNLQEQLIIGVDYIAYNQDKARELGKGEGAIIHEWPKHWNVVTGDVAKGALCFARAGNLLQEAFPEKSEEYIKRSIRSFNWLSEKGPLNHPGGTNFGGDTLPNDGFEPKAYGVPEDFERPEEWKTRDLVMMCWTALELSDNDPVFKDRAVALAAKISERQISKEQAEEGLYGHFRAFASAPFSEKAWEHSEMGYDVGSTFPHYLIPIIRMTGQWSTHPDAGRWKKMINDFAYGYFLPACSSNPFYLLPSGYFTGEGLLTFSGLWHGINGAYGSAAALALELERFTGDSAFKKIATGNLQWIAGLNSGVEEENTYVSKSMIYGIGDEFMGSWTKIPGSICNGFESDKQFVFDEPRAETDGPFYFTDEDWITHAGGWLSAISRFNAK